MKINDMFGYLRALATIFLCILTNGVFAQSGNPEVLSGTIGLVDFKVTAPSGWKIKDSPEAVSKVADILADEGIKFKQNFVFANEKTGALLFGYWNEFPRGFAFEASQALDREPTFPDSWGIDPGQVTSGVKTSYKALENKGIEYAIVRAVGMGDGKTFVGKSKSLKTLAIWANVPIQYESQSKSGAGMIMLQYRGPDFNDGKNTKLLVDTQKMAGDTLIRDLIDSFKIESNVSIITAEEYKSKYPKEGKLRSKDKAEVGAAVAGPQQGIPETSKSVNLDLDSKFPPAAIEFINNAR
jgi:hypothetical protein